jgi:hypothetical protein
VGGPGPSHRKPNYTQRTGSVSQSDCVAQFATTQEGRVPSRHPTAVRVREGQGCQEKRGSGGKVLKPHVGYKAPVGVVKQGGSLQRKTGVVISLSVGKRPELIARNN